MPELNKPGTYMAQIIDCGISPGKPPSKSQGWLARLAITHRLEGGEEGEWIDVNADGLEVFANQNIVLKDGESLNEIGLGIVKDCLQGKWDGLDFGALQNGESFKDLQLKIVCDAEVYDGRETIKVKRMGAPDSNLEGGMKKLDDAGIKALNARFREKLKAQAGPAVAAKPAGKKL